MDHSSHQMDMSMPMSMGTFHWSALGDAIWFDSWLPKSEGAYVGACIGLFLFSVFSRGILALEIYFVAWRAEKCISNAFPPVTQTRGDAEKNTTTMINRSASDSSTPTSSVPPYPAPMALPTIPPFSWATDPLRSFLTALASFVNYLLMLVVMTGNGGFFIVVIVGVFVGELAFGRFRSLGGLRVDEHIH